MKNINEIRNLSIWIFIVPLAALNLCLILITNFHQLFNPEHVIFPTIPYIDGGVSISRTARVFPTYLIFKPAMFITAFLLIKYWKLNYNLMQKVKSNFSYRKFFLFFGIGSAILLILHSIFLGIKFDNDFYKLFRRLVIASFIFFEVIAQTFLVINLYKVKRKISKFINTKVLNLKISLVSILIIVAIVSLPIVSAAGNVHFKHALEWNYFVGVISFYLLTFFFWKRN